jgi:lipoprotein-anchoring transpeptidase ErfK/SrfK
MSKFTSLQRLALLALALLAALSAAALAPAASAAAAPSLSSRLATLSYLPSPSPSSSELHFAIIAFQKQAGLSRDGVAGPQTLAALKKANRPQPSFTGAGRRAEVSLGKQLLYLIRAGVVVRTIPISSGRPGLETVRGSFHIQSQFRMSYSKPYQSWMPYASYFYGGYALHGYPDYEVPTYPASHGCVRIPMDFAYEVYHFLQVGDPVRVY